MEFTYAHGKGFTASRILIEENGSAMVSVGADVEDRDDTYPSEELLLVVRIQGAKAMTVEEVERQALNRASVILQAAGRALSDQIHVDPR